MAAATNKTDLRWVTSAVLVALAGRDKSAGDTFTSQDMLQWVPSLTLAQRKHAAHTLISMGFVTQETRIGERARSYSLYTITAEGEAAIKAIAQGEKLTSGPKGPHQVDRQPGSQTFAVRLWALMRARTILDSETAAETLVDAGDDTAIAKASKNAQRYLARWASTGALSAGREREANGCKRYVLTKDCGPMPPAWTPKAKARQAAQTNE